MKAVRHHPRLALAGLGVLAVLAGYTDGWRLLHGYEKRGGAFLLHAGVYALLLAGVAALLDHVAGTGTARRALGEAALAMAVLFPLAVGFTWYDVVIDPPPMWELPPSITYMAIDRLELVLALSPLGAGHVLGGTARPAAGRPTRGAVVAGLFAVSGPVLAAALAVMSGAYPGRVIPLHLTVGFASLAGALPVSLLARWGRGG